LIAWPRSSSFAKPERSNDQTNRQLEEKINSKKREVDRLTKNLSKEKSQVMDLKKKVKDSRNFSNNSMKDYEALIFSLYDDFDIVIEICIANVKDFKNGLCSFG